MLGRGRTPGTVQVIESAQFLRGDATFENTSISVKRLTGFTSPEQGGMIAILHGLDSEKIIGIITKVADAPGGGLPSDFDDYTGGGYSYNWYHDSTAISIQNVVGDSQYILSKPVSVLIFYIAVL